ncbi:MAG: carboxymethylenebutenolidase [Alphaproteobacteria bacterium 64-11]|nr:dienelactone hydrolase family protein [Alphaproteobacteria bacterium]OJU10905.1 MAG: carboxymethylenebutenolidase [Alphaproteobacteria bacterium 64-11]
MGQKVSINGRDGNFDAYLAIPASAEGPGVVVIQEIFGINAVVRGVADWLAGLGYFALAPDLFWRLEPGVELTDRTDAEWQQALDLMHRFDPDTGVDDIQSTIDHLRVTAGVSGKVGAVGYCLGGLLAFLTAARTDSDATVAYYGVNIQTKLDEAATIRKPLMLHIAAEDGFVPKYAQDMILAGLKDNRMVTAHVYAGVDHAFARPGGKNYNEAAAGLANRRTAEFFQQHLG